MKIYPIPQQCKVEDYINLTSEIDIDELDLYGSSCSCDECQRGDSTTSLVETEHAEVEIALALMGGNR